MKWKITGRFLLAITITILISVIIFTAISLFPAINLGEKPAPYSLWRFPGSYTLDFAEYISRVDGKVVIDEKGIEELKKHHLWIQVLNEDGEEIYSSFKPQGIPTEYSPGRLVYYHEKSGKLGNSTILAGLIKHDQQEICYLIGFPADKIDIVTFVINPRTVIFDIFKVIMKATIVSLIVGTLIAYIFSKHFINLIIKMIEDIKELARGDYSDKSFNVKLFQSVFENLNNLASTLKLSQEERKKTDQTRKEWIDNISHDVKTPLSSIRGYAELLSDPDYELTDPERIEYAEIIMDKANYITELTEDLKLTYQLQNDLLPLEKEEENLVDIVRDSVISIMNNRENQQKDIHFEPEEEVFLLKCNARLLQRVFFNIIYNAIIHNPAGTEVVIRLGELENCSGLGLIIEDNGRGIVADDLDKLFDRYYRGTDTGQGSEGSGLGLAIARQIIQFHGATIEVESETGFGTRVIICF